MKNYYKILEVNETTSSEVIKASYKALMKKFHPDNMGSQDVGVNHNKVSEINEAYEVLSNADRRRQYDLEYKKYFSQNQTARNAGGASSNHTNPNTTQNQSTGSSSNYRTNSNNGNHSNDRSSTYSNQETTYRDTSDSIKKNSSCLGTIVKWAIIIIVFSYILKACNSENPEEEKASNESTSSDVQEETEDTIPSTSSIISSGKDDKGRVLFTFHEYNQLINDYNEKSDSSVYHISLVEDSKGVLTFMVDDTEEAGQFIYQGELKDGKPDGIGNLYVNVNYDTGDYYSLYYKGWFSDGHKVRYGKEYHIPMEEEIDRLDNIYSLDLLEKYESTGEELPDDIWDELLNQILSELNYLTYEGEYDENGAYSGFANMFYRNYGDDEIYGNEDGLLYHIYVQTGIWENGQMNGSGTLYGDQGEILYQGFWKEGNFVENELP